MPTDTTFGGIPDGGHRTAANPLPMKHILSYTRRALVDYGMIRSGERIAVGVSAGKDSLTLLCALARLRQFYPIPFELSAITGTSEKVRILEHKAKPFSPGNLMSNKIRCGFSF